MENKKTQNNLLTDSKGYQKMPVTPQNSSSDLQSRMAGAEANISALGRDVQQLTDALSSYAKDTTAHLQHIADKGDQNHKELSAAINASSKFSWSPILSGFAIALTLIMAMVGFAANGYIRDMDRLENNQTEIISHAQEHYKSEGHPSLVKQVEYIRGELVSLKQHLVLSAGGHAKADATLFYLEKELDLLRESSSLDDDPALEEK